MKKMTPALAIFAMAVTPQVFAEVSAKTCEMNGSIANPIDVDASVGTTLSYWEKSAGDTDHKDDAPPFPYTGSWTFTWNGDTPETVDFTGAAVFGDHTTVTDAGGLGGVTRQTFYNFSHHFKGAAQWNAETRTLSYDLPPKGRDDSQASTVEQDKEPTCDKIKGFTAGKACSAFEATSPPFEGLRLHLVFSEDMSSVEGEAVMTQFGGDGMTKAQTDVRSTLASASCQ